MNRFLFLCSLALPVCSALSQQAPATRGPSRAEVLVLGVYHMANPGHDIFNMNADDVLSPKRQQENAQLLELVKKFRPTKIAREPDVFSQRAPNHESHCWVWTHQRGRTTSTLGGYKNSSDAPHN